MLPPQIHHSLKLHASKGSKKSRRRQLNRVRNFVRYCGCDPRQIGARHVHQFFAERDYAATTARDYWYAIALLWRVLGRHSLPPKPAILRDQQEVSA